MIHRWIIHNFWTKAASVCLAVLVWLYVSAEQNMEVTHEIPIHLKLPANTILVDINSPNLLATFRGAKSIVQKVEFDKIQYSRDLSGNAQPGKITFMVTENDIQLPKFISVTNLVPQEITMPIDPLAEKELAVEPVLTGSPVDGFKVDGVSVNPSIVKLKGPATILKRSSKIGTQSVDLAGRNRSFFQKVGVSSFLKGQEPDTVVEVYVRIREEVEEKVFDNHPVKILQSSSQGWEAKLDPEKATVLVGGNKEILAKLTAGEITLFLDLAELKPGAYELPLQSKSPKDVTILKTTPAIIKVKAKEVSANIQ